MFTRVQYMNTFAVYFIMIFYYYYGHRTSGWLQVKRILNKLTLAYNMYFNEQQDNAHQLLL